MILFAVDENNEVTSKASYLGFDLEGHMVTELTDFTLGDIYDPATKTFSRNPLTAVKAQVHDIDAEIAAIEAKTFRPLREIQLGIDDGTAAALLADYQAQIGTLREQRATLVAQLPGGTL